MNNIPPRPYWSGRNSFREVGLEGLVFGLGVEAGAGLVDAGEVTMTEDLGLGVVLLQGTEQGGHGCLLEGGTGIGRIAALVEAALVADTEAVGVVPLGMGTELVLGATDMQMAVTGDVVVVAAAVEAPCTVAGFKGIKRKRLVATCGRAVNDNQIDRSHGLPFLRAHSSVRRWFQGLWLGWLRSGATLF